MPLAGITDSLSIDGVSGTNDSIRFNLTTALPGVDIGTVNIDRIEIMESSLLMTSTGNIWLNASNGITFSGTLQTTTGNITVRGSQIGTGDNSSITLDGLRVNATGAITSVDGNISLKAAAFRRVSEQLHGLFVDGGTIATTGTGNNVGNIEIVVRTHKGSSSGLVNYGAHLINGMVSTVDGNITLTGTGAYASSDNAGLFLDNFTIASTGSGNIDMLSTVDWSVVDDLCILKNSAISVVDGNLSITAKEGDDENRIQFEGVELRSLVVDGCSISSSGIGTIDLVGLTPDWGV